MRFRARLGAAAAATAVAATTAFGIGQATAETSAPQTDQEIPNLTQVQDKIKAYYGDTVTADGEHYASPTSNYARQVRGIEDTAKAHLKAAAQHTGEEGRPAIVVDVDDTTLLTYNFELQVGFHFTQEAQDAYLKSTDMDPVFGMDKLVNWAHDEGIEVFYVTGRKEYQRDWSARNLKNVGYQAPADREHFYLKDKENPPSYLPCGADCSTVEYKSGTRKHIESQGYNIVANFGDQYSDLKGGYADRTFKLPNPMYYLP